jgi:glycosyltransferase involved in cell wall biosynthesis
MVPVLVAAFRDVDHRNRRRYPEVLVLAVRVLSMSPSISVVIPTMASIHRTPLLFRAIASVLHDGAHPIVVVNGTRYHPDTLRALQRRTDLTCFYFDRGDHCAARLVGRLAVKTEFFALLDDDDEYLPGALRYQMEHIAGADVLVTNGFVHTNGQDQIAFKDLTHVGEDPITALLGDNCWVHPGGALYRTAQVPAHYFKAPPSMELTYTALRLVLTRKFLFDNTPTFRWYHATPESLSATPHWQFGEPDAIQRMLALQPPYRFKRMLAKKYSASLHRLFNLELAAGRRRAAWKWHLRSLMTWYGWRYLLASRHLLRVRMRPADLTATTRES